MFATAIIHSGPMEYIQSYIISVVWPGYDQLCVTYLLSSAPCVTQCQKSSFGFERRGINSIASGGINYLNACQVGTFFASGGTKFLKANAKADSCFLR